MSMPNSPNNSNNLLAGSKPPAPLDLQTNSVDNWSMWKRQWSNYVIVSRLNNQPVEYQTAMLLNSIGTDALKVYNGFVLENDDIRNLAAITIKFDEHINGRFNETYERYMFNSRKHATGETFDTYLTDLQHLAKNCNFCTCMSDTRMRDRVVIGIHNNETRKRLLVLV